MAIGDDFGIDYINKRIYHSSGTTVYTAQALYSWLQDTFDEEAQMDDDIPMSAQTPTAFTMINSWFLDIGEGSYAHRYLSGGAIATTGYEHGATYPQGVRLLKLESGTWHTLTSGDIGTVVDYTGGSPTDSGICIGYDNTLHYIWVRPDDAGDTFSDTATLIRIDGDDSDDLIESGGSSSGEELFTNIFTLGTIESTPAPQIYVFQDGEAISEWSSLTNWDRGQIDVLLQVVEAGSTIGDGTVTVFARQQGDLYDNFNIDLSNGGRNAVPLATSADLDNTSPDYYIFYDGGNGTDFQAYEIITDDGGDWSAEVATEVEWSAGVGVLGIRGFKGTIADGDTFTGGTSGGTGTINGSATGVLGTGYIKYASQGGNYTTGDVLTGGTSGAKRRIIGDQDNGTDGYLLYDTNTGITGTSRDAYYKDFNYSPSTETITDETSGTATTDSANTDAISGFDDITIAFVNGTVDADGFSGTFTEGERITWTDGGSQEGILIASNGSDTITVGNCTDDTFTEDVTITGDISGASCAVNSGGFTSAHTTTKNFEQQSSYNYDVIVECGSIYNAGRLLADVYEYFKFVCEEDSTFQMYTVVSSVITPLDGEEYITAYTGYTPKKASPLGTFAGGVLFAAQGVWVEGMNSSDNQNFSLIDSDGNVRTPPIQATMKVTSVVSADRVAVFLTSGGDIDQTQYTSHASNNTASSATFEIQEDIATDTPSSGKLRVIANTATPSGTEDRYSYSSWSGKIFSGVSPVLVRTYDGTDTAYVPLIDSTTTSDEIEQTVIYAADRDVMIRVRKKGIIPFETAGSFTSAGLTVAAIRTTDTIVT